MNYHPDRHYTTRSGAREAARRLFKKTNGLLTVNGVTREWDMDCVAVYAEGREWTFFIRPNEVACAMAEVEAQERLDMEDEAYFERIASTEEAPRETEAHHPLLTDEAMQSCAEKARRAISDASGLLISLHGRAERRFNGGATEEELQALTELSALANMAIAMLSRFDNHAAPKLDKALAQNS